LSYLTRPLSARDPVLFPELSDREREVLELLARGMSNSQIARELSSHPRPCATTSATSSPNSKSTTAPKQ
jgi:FixJ family two-component response regulator